MNFMPINACADKMINLQCTLSHSLLFEQVIELYNTKTFDFRGNSGTTLITIKCLAMKTFGYIGAVATTDNSHNIMYLLVGMEFHNWNLCDVASLMLNQEIAMSNSL